MSWYILSLISFVLITAYIVYGLRRGIYAPGNPRDILFRKADEGISPARSFGYVLWIVLFTIIWPLCFAFIGTVVFVQILSLIINRIASSANNHGKFFNRVGSFISKVLTGKSQ